MKGFIMGLVAVSVPTVAVSNKISGTRNGAVSTNDTPGTKKLNEDCSTNWECGDRLWCGGPPQGGSRGDKCRDHECKEVDAMQKTCPDPSVPNGVCNEAKTVCNVAISPVSALWTSASAGFDVQHAVCQIAKGVCGVKRTVVII